jgi:hypothetical protein
MLGLTWRVAYKVGLNNSPESVKFHESARLNQDIFNWIISVATHVQWSTLQTTRPVVCQLEMDKILLEFEQRDNSDIECPSSDMVRGSSFAIYGHEAN